MSLCTALTACTTLASHSMSAGERLAWCESLLMYFNPGQTVEMDTGSSPTRLQNSAGTLSQATQASSGLSQNIMHFLVHISLSETECNKLSSIFTSIL